MVAADSVRVCCAAAEPWTPPLLAVAAAEGADAECCWR
jgi:hypothetical protein